MIVRYWHRLANFYTLYHLLLVGYWLLHNLIWLLYHLILLLERHRLLELLGRSDVLDIHTILLDIHHLQAHACNPLGVLSLFLGLLHLILLLGVEPVTPISDLAGEIDSQDQKDNDVETGKDIVRYLFFIDTN